MCVISMVMDHYHDKWWDKWNLPQPVPRPFPFPVPMVPVPTITPEEIAEFRKLLARAREYDKKHNQPDCELQEKRDKVKELARKMGVEIDFI